MNNTPSFTDQEMLQDMLAAQKMVTGGYNTFANECASDGLKNEFVALLGEEHQIQHDLFVEMQKRGWYQTEPADQAKINQAKGKFQQLSN